MPLPPPKSTRATAPAEPAHKGIGAVLQDLVSLGLGDDTIGDCLFTAAV